jgi:hypothetical protein
LEQLNPLPTNLDQLLRSEFVESLGGGLAIASRHFAKTLMGIAADAVYMALFLGQLPAKMGQLTLIQVVAQLNF